MLMRMPANYWQNDEEIIPGQLLDLSRGPVKRLSGPSFRWLTVSLLRTVTLLAGGSAGQGVGLPTGL